MDIERGDILLVELDPTRGAEIQKTRPGIVVTNDIANIYSKVLMIVPITSQKTDKIFPHEVFLGKSRGLVKSSKATVSQMRAIDRTRIKAKLGKISESKLAELDIALKLHLGLA